LERHALTLWMRPARLDDSARIAAWLSEAETRRFLSSPLRDGPIDAALVRAALRRPDQAWFLFGVDDEPAGLVAFDGIDKADGIANIWYVLGEQGLAGRGLTTAALKQILADNPLRLVTATAWVAEPNAASVRCLEKAGFRPVGRVTRAFRDRDGRRYDRLLYEKPMAGG